MNMLKRTAAVVCVLAVVIAGVWIGQAMSQETTAPKAPATATAAPATKTAPTGSATATASATATTGFGGLKMDPEAMKAAAEKMRTGMYDRLKEQLGSTDDEWKILEPRLAKVVNLTMEARVSGTGIAGMLMGGGGGGRRGGGFMSGLFGASTEPSAVETAGQNLQKVVDNKESTKEDFRAALSTLREARAKVRVELETAQKDLREILSVRQEAQLVSMGILD
jgi:hypothetical protein